MIASTCLLTDEERAQAMSALEQANAIRTARAEIKKDLRARTTTVREILDLPEAQTWKVNDLLRSQRGWGPERARKIMRAMVLRPSITVAQLGERRRAEIAAIVDGENARLHRFRTTGSRTPA